MISSHKKLLFFVTLSLLGLSSGTARADLLGAATNYGILVDVHSGGSLQSSNGAVVGNIGMDSKSGGSMVANTSGSITGNIDFSSASGNTVQNSTSPAYMGTITEGVTAVATDYNTISSLASSLFMESGTALNVNLSQDGNQTINVLSGVSHGSGSSLHYDFTINGNNKLNLNSNSASNGLTIDGTGFPAGASVVINIASSSFQAVNGAITLTGGITSDEVIFNIQGGGNFKASSNHNTETGTWLAVGEAVTWNAVTLNGRLYGGDGSSNFQINSGFNLNQPFTQPVPEPSSLVLTSLACSIAGMVYRRRRSRTTR